MEYSQTIINKKKINYEKDVLILILMEYSQTIFNEIFYVERLS